MIGSRTEALLDRQREGTGASQPVSGAVAHRAYRRYLDSFTRPMPEFGVPHPAPDARQSP